MRKVSGAAAGYGVRNAAVNGGEKLNRYSHCGCKIAIALLSAPKSSTLLRTVRRVKVAKEEFAAGNARPDFQVLLTGIDLGIWVDFGGDVGNPSCWKDCGRQFCARSR
jgi:hypothetical protein